MAGRWYEEAHDVGPVDWDRPELRLFRSELMVVADNEDARQSMAAEGGGGTTPRSCASVLRFWSRWSSETSAGNCNTVTR